MGRLSEGVKSAAFLIVALSVFMLLDPIQAISQAKETRLEWKRQNKDNETVIVFVHGFRGDRKTWLNEESVEFWPQIIKDDPVFDDANIALYLYPSDVLAPGASIESMARFAQTLMDEVRSYKNIVFIAHSMGGIVVKTMLLGQQEIVQKSNVRLHLFGVPSSGVEVSGVYSLFYDIKNFKDGPVEHLQQLVESSASSLLTFHNFFWDSIRDRVPTDCYFEGKPLEGAVFGVQLGKVVVSQDSATRHCDTNTPLADFDHISMVKPKDVNHPIHAAFRTNYERRKSVLKPGAEAASGEVFVDTLPKAAKKTLYSIGPAIPYRDGGIRVAPGKYLIEAQSGSKRNFDTINVSVNSGVSKQMYLSPERGGASPQFCVYGPSGAEVSVSEVGKNAVLHKFVLKQGSETECTYSRSFQAGSYYLTARKEGYNESRSDALVLASDNKIWRFMMVGE